MFRVHRVLGRTTDYHSVLRLQDFRASGFWCLSNIVNPSVQALFLRLLLLKFSQIISCLQSGGFLVDQHILSRSHSLRCAKDFRVSGFWCSCNIIISSEQTLLSVYNYSNIPKLSHVSSPMGSQLNNRPHSVRCVEVFRVSGFWCSFNIIIPSEQTLLSVYNYSYILKLSHVSIPYGSWSKNISPSVLRLQDFRAAGFWRFSNIMNPFQRL